MADPVDLLAYCGLYCGDCAGYSGDVAHAARALADVLERYRFERTARSLFRAELPHYEEFRKALDFVSGLTCAATCRERDEPCDIARCCTDRGLHGCYECDDYRTCDRLASLEDLHGDSCVLNIESIRRMGPEAWVARARRLWFGTDVDGPPSE